MANRCLFEPTESGHCATCGRSLPVACPISGGDPTNLGDAPRNLGLVLGAAALAALGFANALEFLGDVIEGTADDDRA